MAFLTKTALLAYIDEEELDEIIDNDDAKLTTPMSDAEGRVRGKLNHRYDIEAVFLAPDNAKYSNVKKIAVDIAIYYLYDFVAVRHVPDGKLRNFERAEADLYDLATGAWDNDLPLLTVPEGEEQGGEGYAGADDFIETNLY